MIFRVHKNGDAEKAATNKEDLKNKNKVVQRLYIEENRRRMKTFDIDC